MKGLSKDLRRQNFCRETCFLHSVSGVDPLAPPVRRDYGAAFPAWCPDASPAGPTLRVPWLLVHDCL